MTFTPPVPAPLTRRLLLSGAAMALCTATSFANAMGQRPMPQDFGAKGDGVSDDGEAISAWLDHIIDLNLHGYLPPGDYLIGAIVRKRLTKIARFGIIGAGSQLSRLIVPEQNIDGAIDINGFNNRSHEISLSSFSILVTGQSEIGLRVLLPEGGGKHQRSLWATDLWARSNNKTTDHFVTAFDFTGCWRPRLQNCGWDGPFIQVTDAENSPRFGCKTGFNLDGCYGLSVEDCYAWGCETGMRSKQYVGQITKFERNETGGTRVTLANGPMPFSKQARVTIAGDNAYRGDHRITPLTRASFDIDAPFKGDGTGSSSLTLGPEGMNFKDNTINGVKTGLWIERPNGREPTCWINGNHINYRDAGIILDGIKIIQMDQNNTYNEDLDQTFEGTPIDLDLRNASEYIISGHVFHFDGHSQRIGIHVESDTNGEGDNGLIHHCIFSGRFATAIHLTDGVSGVRVGPNLYPGDITRRVRDLGTSNTIL